MKSFTQTLTILISSAVLVLTASAHAVDNKQKKHVLSPWQPAVYDWVGEEYGPKQKKRAYKTYQLVADNLHGSDVEKLNAVNIFYNNVTWINDDEHWGETDYWASPMETILTLGGDCEDLAMAKFSLLRGMGINPKQMMLTYVTIPDRGNIAHMVLYYWHNTEKTGVPLVLDNMIDEVLPKPERKDLAEVYNIDSDNIRIRGKEISSASHKNIRAVRIKYIADAMLLRYLNNDKPLMPYSLQMPHKPIKIKDSGKSSFEQ